MNKMKDRLRISTKCIICNEEIDLGEGCSIGDRPLVCPKCRDAVLEMRRLQEQKDRVSRDNDIEKSVNSLLRDILGCRGSAYGI